MNPKLRFALTMLCGALATLTGAWVGAKLWPGWIGTLASVAFALVVAAVIVPILNDARREMHQ
jgi:membrane protein YdbS with pleckstrin-like domain